MRFRKKKRHPLKVVRIARVEWDQEDALSVKQLVKSPTFLKLVAVLNGYLVTNILRGVNDSFRRGYLACMADIQNIGNAEAPLEDSAEQVSMQDLDEDDF